MDIELYKKADMLQFEMGHIRGSIERIERGRLVFSYPEEHQNVIDHDILQEIQKEANDKVLKILKDKLQVLQDKFDKL